MEINFSEEESSALTGALESYLSDLRMEITNTDNPSFRRGLRHERELLDGIVSRLAQARVESDERDDRGRVIVRWSCVYAAEARQTPVDHNPERIEISL